MTRVELILNDKDLKVIREIFSFMDIRCYDGFIGDLNNMSLDEINESITNIHNQLNYLNKNKTV